MAERLAHQDRYELLDLIGRGASGAVYRAIDRVTTKLVAVRVTHHASPRELNAARAGVQSVARVISSHVVEILETLADLEALRLIVVMELVEGPDVLEWLGRRGGDSIQSSEFVEVFRQVLCGLAHLHRCGIVHRDIKPANIIVQDDRRAVIVDFGAVLSLEQADSVGYLAGTAAYLAPEVVLGERASPSSDLYSVGVIMYAALTGRLPFDGPPVLVHANKQAFSVTNDGHWLPRVSPVIARLVAALLLPEPERRPSSRELLDTLLSFHGRSIFAAVS